MEQKQTDQRTITFWQRLRTDVLFRRRFIHTIYLLWSFFGLGWAAGQMGPSFPDLRLIVQQNLGTASWIFTVYAFGYLIGSLFSGILYARFNKVLCIACSVSLLAIFSAVTPWCELFPLMLFARFMFGLGCGGLDTCGNADLISLWDKEGRSYMQALHFAFGAGGIISPLATKPFLANRLTACRPSSVNASGGLLVNSSNIDLNMTVCHKTFSDTNVHFAYLITAGLIFSGAIPFFFIFLTSSPDDHNDMIADRSLLPYPNQLPTKHKIIFLSVLASTFLAYCAIEDTYASYLATFCINYFNFDSETSSFATSLYWFLYSLGRFIGIFLVRHFKPANMLLSFFTFLLFSFVGFLITSVTYSSDAFWLFAALPGFSMSVIFPSLFSWTEESILKVSGMISSLFLVASSSGFMLNPLFLGYLMENRSPIWFVYILLGETCICIVLVLILLYLSKVLVIISSPKSNELEPTEQITHM